ncbi:MAG: gidB [Bryobacterales bacterium]|nr:gidB [Bryobacterales bacterium]
MFRELLAREFAPYGSLTSTQLDLLEAHYDLLVQWNARLNLTRIESVEESVRLHYCESLFVGTKLPAGRLRIVDVGSGAGFPGIPIAILRPECTVTLVESHQRKAVFLREATRNVKSVSVVTDRAENLKTEFDWLVSRAVSPDEVVKLNLANSLALLVGGEEIPGFDRRELVPWGTNRYLVFHVKHAW